MGYFKRWSHLPPSPTPSHTSVTASLPRDPNYTSTTTSSDSPFSSDSLSIFSVFRSSSTSLPLPIGKTPGTAPITAPPSPRPQSPVLVEDSNNYHNNSPVNTLRNVPAATSTTAITPFVVVVAAAAAAATATTSKAKYKAKDNNNVLTWRQATTTMQIEYENMPIQRRKGALDRVNKSRLWLNLPEKSLSDSGVKLSMGM
jgi:hypothetical protein